MSMVVFATCLGKLPGWVYNSKAILLGKCLISFFMACYVTVRKYEDLSKGPKCEYAGKEKIV